MRVLEASGESGLQPPAAAPLAALAQLLPLGRDSPRTSRDSSAKWSPLKEQYRGGEDVPQLQN